MPKSEERSAKYRLKHWMVDWTETILVAFFLALVIRAFFLQVFWIPSSSMVPTLNINDRVVVNKIAPFFRDPRRFEVIVFRLHATRWAPKRDLIKRVIGLPGETLEVKQGVVNINGQPLEELHTMNHDYCNYGPVRIPDDSYFVMGDNRPASADSRYFGFLPRNDLIGPALFKIWPISQFSLVR